MSLPLHTLTTPQAVSSALANLSLALLASSTANTPTARAALRAELQCVDDSSTPCAAAAVHPLRGEYCKLLRGEYLLNKRGKSQPFLVDNVLSLKGGSPEELEAQPTRDLKLSYWHSHCSPNFDTRAMRMLCHFSKKHWCIAHGAVLHLAGCGRVFCSHGKADRPALGGRGRGRGAGRRRRDGLKPSAYRA